MEQGDIGTQGHGDLGTQGQWQREEGAQRAEWEQN